MTGHWQVTTQKWVDGVGVVQPNVDANLPSDQYNAKDKNMNQFKKNMGWLSQDIENEGQDCTTLKQQLRNQDKELEKGDSNQFHKNKNEVRGSLPFLSVLSFVFIITYF